MTGDRYFWCFRRQYKVSLFPLLLKAWTYNKIFTFLFGSILVCHLNSPAQIDWETPPIKYEQAIIPKQFKNDALVIINDMAFFNLTNYSIKTLHRNVLVKIQKKAGIINFNPVSLPESFDIAMDKEFWQQGWHSKVKIPFIKTFVVKSFIARKIKPNDVVIPLKPEITYSHPRWVRSDGEFSYDEIANYNFTDLTEGDLLEYSYVLEYKSSYGSDMIYLSSDISKVNVEYSFNYIALPNYKNSKFVLTSNIPDSCITSEIEHDKNLARIKETIRLKNVQRVNYFIHAMSSKQLPYIYFNMNYTIKLFNNKSYSVVNLPDFSWTNYRSSDTLEFRWHTKFPDDIRKFVNTFPVFEKDNNNMNFLKAVIDTLNCFTFHSASNMFYNEPRLYSLYSTDHLFKRRISEMNLFRVYEGILNCKKSFYYIANLQDKRLGENNPLIRNRAYENLILAIPNKHSYVYFVPRYNGLKYYLNELPFYFQGAVAALFPYNYVKLPGDTMGNHFRFVRTYSATDNENTRVENCIVKINIDSLQSRLMIMENLSGQFSTLLRPLYLEEIIDSTVNKIYFKTCLDKPHSFYHKTELKSKSEEFPFSYTFNCSEVILNQKQGEIDLKYWFSFLLDKNLIPEKPTHDFYFDFPFSDVYNFEFEFNKPVEIKNADDFNKSVYNDYFELNSELKKQDSVYIWAVKSTLKKSILPKENASLLMEFIDELDYLNNLKIYIKN